MIDEELTRKIIKAFYAVYNTLGYGFIERLYHNAMIIEIVQGGLSVEVEKPIAVYYGPNLIGNFEADLVVYCLPLCPKAAGERCRLMLQNLEGGMRAVGIVDRTCFRFEAFRHWDLRFV